MSNHEKIYRAQLFQAAELLARITAGTLPADKQMELFFRERRNMGARDRGFVAEAVYGVLRHRRRLEWIGAEVAGDQNLCLVVAWLVACAGWSARAVEEKGIPVAVEALVQRARSEGASALPFAVQASLPDWLAERLVVQYGEEEASRLAAALNRPAPVDLRVNTLKASRAQLLARLAEEGYPAAPTPYSPVGVRREGRAPLFKTAAFREGWFEVQDEGSQLISLLMEAKRGEQVVDLCAGGGGKTLHLGAMMDNGGSLEAFDVAPRRLENLKERLRRAGLHNVRATAIRSETDPELKRWRGRADRVLVDAPCSGTGTLRRNPDIKWREPSLTELVEKQGSILAAAARLVRPGGRLVYATCSLLREENEGVVERFLGADPAFTLQPAGEILARYGIALAEGTPAGFLRLAPHLHGTDGFFAAVLQRSE